MAAFADNLMQSVRHFLDESPCSSGLQRRDRGRFGYAFLPQADVPEDGIVEERYLLRHISQQPPPLLQVDLPQIDTVDQNASLLRLVKADKQVDCRGLPHSGRPGERGYQAAMDV